MTLGVRNIQHLFIALLIGRRLGLELPQYPFLVSIQMELTLQEGESAWYHMGQGSFVAKNTVLTSCNYLWRSEQDVNTGSRNMQVMVGSNTLGKNSSEKFRAVLSLVCHPNFIADSQKHVYINDIALLKIANARTPFQFEETIPFSETGLDYCTVDDEFVSMGWNCIIKHNDGGHAIVKEVRSRKMRLVYKWVCAQQFGNLHLNEFQSLFCAIGYENEGLSCMDNGSPIASRTADDRYELIGIISMAIGCNVQIPSVFTYVLPFIEWVEETDVPFNN